MIHKTYILNERNVNTKEKKFYLALNVPFPLINNILWSLISWAIIFTEESIKIFKIFIILPWEAV